MIKLGVAGSASGSWGAAMDALKALVQKKKSALADKKRKGEDEEEERGGRKYLKNSERQQLEAERQQRQQQSSSTPGTDEPAAVNGKGHEGTSTGKDVGANADEPILAAAEVKRKLRSWGEPVTLFGESDRERFTRMKKMAVVHAERELQKEEGECELWLKPFRVQRRAERVHADAFVCWQMTSSSTSSVATCSYRI